jgi:hypothetical protein
MDGGMQWRQLGLDWTMSWYGIEHGYYDTTTLPVLMDPSAQQGCTCNLEIESGKHGVGVTHSRRASLQSLLRTPDYHLCPVLAGERESDGRVSRTRVLICSLSTRLPR